MSTLNTEDYEIICRPFITIKGKRIYAYQKGLKAFCFKVKKRPPQAV